MKKMLIEISSSDVNFKSYPLEGPIALETLGISESLLRRIKVWSQQYEKANHDESIQYQTIDSLEQEGIDITLSLLHELPDFNFIYHSDLLMLEMLPRNR